MRQELARGVVRLVNERTGLNLAFVRVHGVSNDCIICQDANGGTAVIVGIGGNHAPYNYYVRSVVKRVRKGRAWDWSLNGQPGKNCKALVEYAEGELEYRATAEEVEAIRRGIYGDKYEQAVDLGIVSAVPWLLPSRQNA